MTSATVTSRTRLEQCIAGEITDRTPVALWRHFPVDDQSPDSFAAAVIAFQEAYQFDFVKVTPASSYCIKDWGVKDEWTGNPHGTRDYIQRSIHSPEDWLKLHHLNPHAGSLGQILESLKQIINGLPAGTPVIHTIFSPLSQAKNLVGPQELLVHLRKYPEAITKGLQIIQETTLEYIRELAKLNIDGIFYAVQHAQYELLSREEFTSFGRSFDLEVLSGLPKQFWLNVGHIHGKDIMFDLVADYPVQVMNWHDQETYPSLPEALDLFPGVVCGGLRQESTMVLGTPEDVRNESRAAIDATGQKRFILGTGCVLPVLAPQGNILATQTTFLAE